MRRCFMDIHFLVQARNKGTNPKCNQSNILKVCFTSKTLHNMGHIITLHDRYQHKEKTSLHYETEKLVFTQVL